MEGQAVMLQTCAALRQTLREAVGRVVMASGDAVDALATGLLAGGHVLIEGVPGVAKTTLARTFAGCLGLAFRRVQFTADLLPGDIVGTHVFVPPTGDFVRREGPVFTELLLADELNRSPAKTQGALLEAMQEGQVTLEGSTYPLPRPFFVIATQNPLEERGVYALPDAQLDRFLLRFHLPYPPEEEELAMLAAHRAAPAGPERVVTRETLLALIGARADVVVAPSLQRWMVTMARATREHDALRAGVSPRALLALQRAAQARAMLEGRDHVVPADIEALVPLVWSHRVQVWDDLDDGRASEHLPALVQQTRPSVWT